MSDIQPDLDRRRPGQSRLVTQRDEADRVEILSGVVDGLTLGSPIALLVRNKDQNSGAYDHMKDLYRPSHADFTTEAKYGIRAVAGGGRASARETIGRVAAAAVARKLLAERFGIEVLGWVSQVHTITSAVDAGSVSMEQVEADPTRCPDPDAAAEMIAAIEQARRDGDSLGGIVTCVARGVPAGWGEPVFDKLEADLAKAVMSLPASKGFEVGSGFGSVDDDRTGAQRRVRAGARRHATHARPTGRAASRAASRTARTSPCGWRSSRRRRSRRSRAPSTTSNEPTVLAAKGRHDPCVLPRAVPLVEAAVLLVLADHWLRQAAISG